MEFCERSGAVLIVDELELHLGLSRREGAETVEIGELSELGRQRSFHAVKGDDMADLVRECGECLVKEVEVVGCPAGIRSLRRSGREGRAADPQGHHNGGARPCHHEPVGRTTGQLTSPARRVRRLGQLFGELRFRSSIAAGATGYVLEDLGPLG